MGKVLCKEINCSKYFDLNQLSKVYDINGVIFFGKTVITDKDHNIKDFDLDSFLSTLKEIVNSEYFEGFFGNPISMDLCNIDVKRNIAVDNDFKPISLTSKYFKYRKPSNPKNVRFRSMLLGYFKSKISKEEINKIFNKEICVGETELPKQW